MSAITGLLAWGMSSTAQKSVPLAVLLGVLSCGGSSSETPPPLEPSHSELRADTSAQQVAAAGSGPDAAERANPDLELPLRLGDGEPAGDGELVGDDEPGGDGTTWGGDEPERPTKTFPTD